MKPRVLSLEISTVCNCACIHCPQKTLKRKGKLMRYPDVLDVVNQAIELGVEHIQPHLYGESHLNPFYIPILRAIVEKAPDVKLTDTTNGSSLAKPEIADAIATYLDELNISLDGIKPETIEHIRPGLDGQKVLDGVKAFIARKDRPRVAITCVVMDCNRDEVEEIRKLVGPEDGFDACEISDLHGYNPEAKKPLREPKPCKRPFTDLCVNVEGDVILCCRDHHSTQVFGNAFGPNGIAGAWDDPDFLEIRKRHLENRADTVRVCKDCTYLGYWKTDVLS